ncbi:MAG: hypothetical protein V2A74_11555 [bacterium]
MRRIRRFLIIPFLIAVSAQWAWPASNNLKLLDERVHAKYPVEIVASAGRGIPSDNSGLIGKNRFWGAMYSPRFQVGAGFALRVALIIDQPSQAALAFRAIEAGTEVIHDDGFIPSTLPDDISHGQLPALGDVASAASFFVGDACMGMLALERSDNPNAIVSRERRVVVLNRLNRATQWLQAHKELLKGYDADAPQSPARRRARLPGLRPSAGQRKRDQDSQGVCERRA